ncbi:uncharacterized protein LOC110374698 [Helicoverpa armigera]|uniref:uncharacterized protein LOC110374698 n=1 Tax=Helicoverpa armigera TaxID=29058 RepID=UPI003082A8E6
MNTTLTSFTDVLVDEICNSQPLSLSSTIENSQINVDNNNTNFVDERVVDRPPKGTGQRGQFRSIEEIDLKYRDVFSYPYFNLVQSSVIEDALYSDKSIVVCAPTGSGKTVIFEMAVVQLLMELENKQYTDDFKIIYMAPVKALCTERLTEWYSKFTKLGLLCIEVTGDTDVDFTQLKPYKVIITTPEKWDMLTRRWRDHRGLVEVIKLFLIDEVHILNDETRGPVLEAVVSRMKTIENSAQSVHRIEQLQKEMQGQTISYKSAPRIRFVAVSATVSNPEDVANWLGTSDKPAVFYKFGDECRPVKLKRIVEGYPCSEGTSIFKFDIILNYKLWPVIQKYHSGKPTLIFCNTRKSVILTAETLSRELTISFNAEQKAKLTALASTIKNKKLQALVMSGVGCHHAGLLYEERQNIELAFRNRDLPILITTTTLAMGVNLPAHLVIVKNTQQYVNGAYQEYSISTVLQMVGRAGRPQFDTEATAVIMTRLVDKPRYQALVGGCEPLQSFLHKRLPENLNSEAALGTVGDVAQCVQWLRSTFLYVRAARDPKKYLGLPQNSPQHLISKKIEELCVKAMNGLASSGLITMDEASCIESTEAGRLMSIFYLDLETMKLIMKIEGTESLDRLLTLICESHELADMHLRVDERRCLNTLNRNNAAATIRYPMKGKISTRQMKLNCIIQAVLGCLPIPDPSLNQEAMKIMRIADRICKCVVTYVTRPDLIVQQPQFYSAILNSILLAKCVAAHLWENSPYVSKQLKGIGPTFSTLLASAGKVNFMLLEESHPRDLERIMNKGAPAGNVLRKQVSLLPKYQLTMIPVDEQTVTVQLVLLNQSYLSENMANLTAGDTHKSYIIVGDSNNHLLLLTAFKDKDLISVYGGTITHEIRRKHNFEHKIIAHCISSTFVGIDVQSEYLFNDLEPFFGAPCTKTPRNDFQVKNKAEKQTCITDTFKERKRKNTDPIAQSKEKKKRETALIENFKSLKKSFESASKNGNLSVRQQNNVHGDVDGPSNTNRNNTLGHIDTMLVNNNAINVIGNDKVCIEDMDSDEFIDDEKIDSILNEIESEMSKNKISKPKTTLNNTNTYFREKNYKENPFAVQHNLDSSSIQSNYNATPKVSSYKTVSIPRKRKPTTTKSNYNFIDLLERNLSLSDEEDKIEAPKQDNGFSDAIKSQISKYLSKTKPVVPDRNLEMLLDNPQITVPSDNQNPINVVDKPIDQDCVSDHSPYPKYEIVEILGDKDPVKQHENIQHASYSKNHTDNLDHQVCEIMDLNTINTNNVIDLTHVGPNTMKTATLQNINNVITNNEDSKNNSIKSLDVIDTHGVQTSTRIINEENFANNRLYIEDSGSENDSNKEDSEKVAKTETNSITIAREIGDKSNRNNSESNVNNQIERIDSMQSNNNPNYVLLDNKEFRSLYESTKTDNSTIKPCLEIVPRDRQHLLQTNTYSDATTTEGVDRRIGLKALQFHENTQNIPVPYSNSSSDLINPQTISGNTPNVIEIDKHRTEYVKRYTYSASKVDVCTKQTPEYCVQLIRKVKMDLDVTAIVSRKMNYFQNNEPDNEEHINKEELNHMRRPNYGTGFQYVTRDHNNMITNSSKVDFPVATVSGFNNYIVENAASPPSQAIDANSSVVFEDNYRNCPNSCKNDGMVIPEIEDVLEEKEIIHRNNEDVPQNVEPVEIGNGPVKEDRTVKNILQKYKKILEKNTAKPVTPSCSSINPTVKRQVSPTKKSAKPFKITDIHKLHATIPETIVEHKPDVLKDITQIRKNINFDETRIKNDNFIPIPFTQYSYRADVEAVEDISQNEFVHDLDIEPINLPDNVDLEPSNDFKLDQSMLDPKTVLQYVADDDDAEIVPPPAEFCDRVTFSPDYTLDSSMDENADETFRNADTEYNDSIFDDACATDLTPSKEIETWNLSREETWERLNPVKFGPAKSFTVMHKNTSNDYILQNTTIPRKVRLGQFKFSQKNKFKIRK